MLTVEEKGMRILIVSGEQNDLLCNDSFSLAGTAPFSLENALHIFLHSDSMFCTVPKPTCLSLHKAKPHDTHTHTFSHLHASL